MSISNEEWAAPRRSAARTAPKAPHRRLERSAAILLPTLALGACAVNPHQRPPDEITRTFAVPIDAADRVLEVRVGNGRVTIVHGDTPACEVSACVRAASSVEAEHLAADVALLPDTDDDHVRVVALHSPKPGNVDTVNLSVTVSAPPQLSLRVLTQRAAVVVQGYRGELIVDTDSGDVTARLDGGSTDIRSRSGSVRLSGTFERADVQTSAGAVSVVLPHGDSRPTIDVKTQVGDVTLEVPQASRVSFSARVRNSRNVPCELVVAWQDYGTDDGDRWKRFRGEIGPSTAAADNRSKVSVVSESGRIALRCLPGS